MPHSATHRGRDRSFAAGELRPGPYDYATAMDDWAPEQRRALAEEVPGSMVHLQEVIGRGIDVTTHYSGTGAAEMACAAIAPGQVKFHGACDFNPTCRKVLIHHGAESAAEHVTTDLCERPPPHILEELRAELRTHQDKFGAPSRASTPSRSPEREVVQAIGLQWVAAAMRILSQWVPAREDGAYCCRHLRHCPTFPPRSKRFHLEIDGINCQPWSVQGKALGWLDDQSIPCLILVQTILSIEPDAVCIECTPRFDFATLQNLLPTYRGDWAITCPTDFGRPVARQRMYMWFDRRASLRRVHAEVSGILDVSRRTVRVEAGIFCRLPKQRSGESPRHGPSAADQCFDAWSASNWRPRSQCADFWLVACTSATCNIETRWRKCEGARTHVSWWISTKQLPGQVELTAARCRPSSDLRSSWLCSSRPRRTVCCCRRRCQPSMDYAFRLKRWPCSLRGRCAR